ncbi:MAG: hypothetical protein IJG33_01260 [Selenomonadaceae bacterium]|nr:hypothetical protein [Selenomonadaceae bacterium]
MYLTNIVATWQFYTLADALLNAVLSEECEDMQEDFSALLEDAKILAKEIFPFLPTNAEISDTVREREFVLGFITQNQSRFIGGTCRDFCTARLSRFDLLHLEPAESLP